MKTQVTTLTLEDNPDLPEQLAIRCDQAGKLGYRLAACFKHLGRLVLVFQKK